MNAVKPRNLSLTNTNAATTSTGKQPIGNANHLKATPAEASDVPHANAAGDAGGDGRGIRDGAGATRFTLDGEGWCATDGLGVNLTGGAEGKPRGNAVGGAGEQHEGTGWPPPNSNRRSPT